MNEPTSQPTAQPSEPHNRFVEIFKKPTPVSKYLLISNVLLWVVAFVLGLFLKEGSGWQIEPLAELPTDLLVFYTGMKLVGHVDDGQWWRLVSSMWVHLSIMHIAFNAYGLYIFSPFIERFYGGRRVLTIYMMSGIIGSAASYLWVDNPSGGASGALYGLVGAMLVFGFMHRDDLPQRVYRALTTGMLPWVVLNIGIGFLDAIPFDNAAHIGGLVGGAVTTLLMKSVLREPRSETTGKILHVLGFAWCGLMLAVALFWAVESVECLGSAKAYITCYPDILEIGR